MPFPVVLVQALARLARMARAFAPGLACVLLCMGARADIVVGQVAPFSGPQAVTGRAIHAGAKLYFDAVNARGGVRGRRIKFVTRDDEQKADATLRLVKDLIQQEAPVALLGTVGTTNLEVLAKDGVLARTRVPMVGAISGAASVARASGMFVVKASYRDEIGRLFTQLAHLDVKRVGIVYQDDGLGQDAMAGAEEAARRLDITLVKRAGYPRNSTNVEAAVRDMLGAKPQVIFLAATTQAAISFVRQYGEAGGQATLYGMSIIDPSVLLKALGPYRARGYGFSVVLPLPSQQKVPLVREYLALGEAAKDPDLSTRSIEGFIAAKLLVRALERAASLEPQAVAAAVTSLSAFDAGGYTLDFSAPGRGGSRFVDFAMFGGEGRITQ